MIQTLLDLGSSLKVVGRLGVGLDNIDLKTILVQFALAPPLQGGTLGQYETIKPERCFIIIDFRISNTYQRVDASVELNRGRRG